MDTDIRPDMSKKFVEWVELENINKLVIGMGGTGTKYNFGASVILAVSLAASKAEAAVMFTVTRSPLWQSRSDHPVPAFRVSHGGFHTGNKLAVRGFMVLPVGAVTLGKLCSWELTPTSTRMMSSRRNMAFWRGAFWS